MTLQPGQPLSFYTVLAPLGSGAMGEVWRARDTRLDREVAIKVLPEHFADDEERLRRFEREARTLASLNHPNVGQIFGVDQQGDVCFLVLELVPGETLEERIARGPLATDEALDVCRQIAAGLEAAHAAGVIHRDLKPANVRITPEHKVKVLDFGLAKPARTAKDASSHDSVLSTEAGRLIGTPTYMAPEQARGRAIDRRVDLWALGCLLYECLTARRAFAGDSLSDVLAAVIEREPDWTHLPATTPPRVRDLVARCLAKDPERRQRDAGDAALELSLALERREWQPAEVRARSRLGLLPWAVAAAALVALSSRWWTGGEVSRESTTPARTVRFEVPIPAGTTLGLSDRLMNELAISPDGSRIAIVLEGPERPEIRLHDVATGTDRVLPLDGTARGPAFSPDGASLAFLSGFDTLWRLPLAGGPPERVATIPIAATGDGDPAWHTDGRFCASFEYGSVLLGVDMRDGTVREVAKPPAGLLGIENVASGPRGLLLLDAWHGPHVGDYRCLALDPRTKESTILIENGSSPRAIGDDLLVFQRASTLMAVRCDFERARVLGTPCPVLEGVTTHGWGGTAQFAVSPEGTLVFAPGRRKGEGRRIVWTGADGSVEAILPGNDVFVEGVHVAAGGKRLVVATLRHARELWCYETAGRVLTPIAAQDEPHFPVLVPGTDQVVFRSESGGKSEVRRVAISGGAAETLCGTGFEPSSCTPDGRELLLAGRESREHELRGGIYTIHLADPSGGARFLFGRDGDRDPQVSPDGAWIAYASARTGRMEVYVRPFRPSEPESAGRPDRGLSTETEWRATESGGDQPRWSPDGKSLYYRDDLQLLAVDVQREESTGELRFGERRKVLRSQALEEANGYGVGADGRIALVELAEWELAQQKLVVIVGWGEELRRRLATGE